MPKAIKNKTNYFILIGQVVNESPTYWNKSIGWSTLKKDATRFPRSILTSPLPIGGVIGALEYTARGNQIQSYVLMTPARGDAPIFVYGEKF